MSDPHTKIKSPLTSRLSFHHARARTASLFKLHLLASQSLVLCYLRFPNIVPSSAITGMRGAAGGRQPAAAKPPWYNIII